MRNHSIEAMQKQYSIAKAAAYSIHARAVRGRRNLTAEENYTFHASTRDAREAKAEIEAEAEAASRPKLWGSAGELLHAYREAERPGGRVDPRMTAAAAIGANETYDSEGGLAVAPEISQTLLHRLYDTDEILSLPMRVPMGSSTLAFPIPSESSRQNGKRFGGVSVGRTLEASAVQTSQSALDAVQLTANKLMGATYLTDELRQDVNVGALSQWIGWAFPSEFRFQLVGEVFGGSGVGEFLGVWNSGATIVVPEDNGQATATVTVTNIENMYARLWAPSRRTGAWFMNQATEEQLVPLERAGKPLYTRPGEGGIDSPYGRMLGLPVIPLEQAPALGQQGDITLADLHEYVIGERTDAELVTSLHVAFLLDQEVFRWTMRNDGSPTWKAPITPYSGNGSLSPFVILAARP